MLRFHRRIIALHKKYRVFARGSLKFLLGSYNCLAFGRFDRTEKMVVVFNNNSEEKELEVKVWPAEVGQNQPMMRLFITDAEGFSEEQKVYPVERGMLKLTMPATSAVVLRAMSEEEAALFREEEARQAAEKEARQAAEEKACQAGEAEDHQTAEAEAPESLPGTASLQSAEAAAILQDAAQWREALPDEEG